MFNLTGISNGRCLVVIFFLNFVILPYDQKSLEIYANINALLFFSVC